MNEYLRPWKLITFIIGIALLIAGAYYYNSFDWDIGISLIMGILAYITAPWVIAVIRSGRLRLYPIAFLAYWVTVDGSYTTYNNWMGHPVSGDLRWANFFASTLLYLLCGWFWLPRISFRGFILELAAALHLCTTKR